MNVKYSGSMQELSQLVWNTFNANLMWSFIKYDCDSILIERKFIPSDHNAENIPHDTKIAEVQYILYLPCLWDRMFSL